MIPALQREDEKIKVQAFNMIDRIVAGTNGNREQRAQMETALNIIRGAMFQNGKVPLKAEPDSKTQQSKNGNKKKNK